MLRPQEKELPPLPKMRTGVEGLDEITGGGLPRHRTTIVTGNAGCGKTILALQTLVFGASQGETGIFVAFEENTRQILANAASFGWDLPRLQREKLFFLDARLGSDTAQNGDFDLTALLAGLRAQAREMGAKRIVFDGIDVLLSLLSEPRAEQREIYRLHDWLQAGQLSGIVTVKIDDEPSNLSERYGFVQFLADCVIVLRHGLAGRVSTRDIRVVKYRGSTFSENQAPMLIGPSGIEIGNITLATQRPTATKERVSSGVVRLDAMLGGGYFRGSGVLIAGAPGTAKTTLCGAFVDAACRRKEHALYLSFDEDGCEIARNLSSVGIRLGPHIKSGLLKMYSVRSEANSAEEHLLKLKLAIRDHQPRCLVIDPFSAFIRTCDQGTVQGVAERLLYLAKSQGITVICTSLLDRTQAQSEATAVFISAVADTWIHLSYAMQAGERNRALTIVKSRGMKHSNQVRELILSHRGVTLSDVYTADGEVLMGTMRWQKEQAEESERENAERALERKRAEIRAAQSELTARVEDLQRELDQKQAELGLLEDEKFRSSRNSQAHRTQLSRIRSGDDSTGGPAGRQNGHVQAKDRRAARVAGGAKRQPGKTKA